MHQTLTKLYNVQFHFQSNLFPNIKEKLVEALEISQLDSFIPYIGRRKCHPTQSRMALARAFLAKAIYNMPTTVILKMHAINRNISYAVSTINDVQLISIKPKFLKCQIQC